MNAHQVVKLLCNVTILFFNSSVMSSRGRGFGSRGGSSYRGRGGGGTNEWSGSAGGNISGRGGYSSSRGSGRFKYSTGYDSRSKYNSGKIQDIHI